MVALVGLVIAPVLLSVSGYDLADILWEGESIHSLTLITI